MKTHLCFKSAIFSLILTFVVFVFVLNENMKLQDLKGLLETRYWKQVAFWLNDYNHKTQIFFQGNSSVSNNEVNFTLIWLICYLFHFCFRRLIKCENKNHTFVYTEHGKFILLKNYARSAQYFRCYDSITCTTHGDFTFLDNVVPLLKRFHLILLHFKFLTSTQCFLRWEAPLSIALYAPGDDFHSTVQKILHLRNCDTEKNLVKRFVSFHIYFESTFSPENFEQDFDDIEKSFLCDKSTQLLDFTQNRTFRARHELLYPVNVGRNLAREAALTHFVLVNDIELYPSLGFVDSFFKMLVNYPKIKMDRKSLKKTLLISTFNRCTWTFIASLFCQSLKSKKIKTFRGPKLSFWICSTES